ncbi:hypothetical protein [Treponema endosymbiont of Eucomonympha sp.]|uniref:hypothetical protein n=1 Tax=Treponema endosymbiont of Eucomonympha sp. TaxID=1580831 RepID=UPI00164F3FF1|nr:hypothetical protein [Treponema endosymbiont of Eucomonympha sp.]
MTSRKASRQNRPITPSVQPKQRFPLSHIQQEIYSGPIPSPDILKKFGEIDASFSDRIMKMAETHAVSDAKTKDRVSLSMLVIPIIL